MVEKMKLCALVSHRNIFLCCLNVPIRYGSRALCSGISSRNEHISLNKSFVLILGLIYDLFCIHGVKSLPWSCNRAWAHIWLMQIKLALEEALSSPAINKYCWIHASSSIARWIFFKRRMWIFESTNILWCFLFEDSPYIVSDPHNLVRRVNL